MAEEVGRLTAVFELDTSPLQRGLKKASAMLEKWAREHDEDPKASVGLDLTPLRRGLAEATRALERFDGSDATAQIKADASPFRRTLAELRGTLKDFSRKDATVRIKADDAEARKTVEDFISWVRQQNVEMRVGAVTQDAQRAAEIAATYISNLSANIDVGADTGSAMVGGRTAASRIGQMTGEIGVDADTSSVMGEAQGAVRRVNAMRGNVDVGANTQPAESELAGFNQTIRRYSRSWGSKGIRARVQADTQQAQAQVRNLERILQNTTQGEHRVRVEAETARARGQLRGLQQIAAGLGMQNPTINTSVRGAAASAAQMMGLYALADKLDGYNIQFKASVDETLSRAMPNMLGALEQQILRFRVVVQTAAAVYVPAFYAALSMLPGAISAAGTAVGAFTTRLGVGLVGAIGSVGSAAILGAGALGTYGYAMRRTLSYAFNLSSVLGDQISRIEDANEAVALAKKQLDKATPDTQEYARAQMGVAFATQNAEFEQRRYNAMLGLATPNMLKMNAAANDLSIRFIELSAAVSNAMAPIITRWLAGITQHLRNAQPAIVEMITGMNNVAATFVSTMGKGRELANLKTIFSGIRSAGVPAMQILTNSLRVFVNIFASMVPAGLKVLDVLMKLTGAAAGWSGTAEGQRTIGRVWAELRDAGAQLWRIVRDLSIALGGVILALNATGIGQNMMNSLEGLAAGFRHVMRDGGRGRAAIVEFGEYTKPVLSAIWDLVKGVARQFGLMAMEVGKSGLMVDMVNALNDALLGTKDGQGIIKMLRHEFEYIAPLLPPLISALGNWFSTFAQAEPEMIFFIKNFTRILELFNSLPEPLKRGIARTMAWGMALKMLGVGALPTVIAKLFLFHKANKMMNASLAASRVQTAAQPGIFARMSAAIKTAAVATWGYVRAGAAAAISAVRFLVAQLALNASLLLTAARIKVVTVAQRALNFAMRMNPIGMIVTALALLAVGLVVAYRRSETFRNAVNALGNFIKNTAVAAFNGFISAIKAVWRWFKKLPGPVQALISPIGAVIANFGTLKRVGVASVKEIWNALKAAWRWISTNTPKVWNGAKSVVLGVGKAIERAAKSVWNAVKSAWNSIDNTTSRVWNGIEAFFTRWWKRLTNFIKGGVNGWKRIISGAWTSIKNTTSSIWTAIRDFFTKWWNNLKTFITNTARDIGRAVADRWKGMQAFAERIWRNIRDFFVNLWESLRDRIVSIARNLGQSIADRWKGMKQTATDLWNSIRDLVSDKVKTMRDWVVETAANLGRTIADRWKGMRDTAGSIFKQLANNMVSNFESGVNLVIRLVNKLSDAIKSVAKAIGLDSIADKLGHISKVSLPRLARGGVVNEYARGGVERGQGQVTSGITAIAGEAGKESIVPLTRTTPEGHRAMEAAAPRYGYKRLPAYRRGGVNDTWRDRGERPVTSAAERRRTSGYAVGMGPTTYNVRPFVRDNVNKIMNNHSGVSWNTYVDHPGGERNSVDFWGGGGRGDPINRSTGNSIVDQIQSSLTKQLDYIIWWGQINHGRGWNTHTGPYNHKDHVHVTWQRWIRRMLSGGWNAAGSAFSGVTDALGNTYNSVTDFLGKMWNPPSLPDFSSYGIAGDVMKGAGQKLLSGAGSFVKDKATKLLTPSGGGGDNAANVKLGKELAAGRGWGSGGQWDALKELWHRESNWSHTAKNPTSGAYGIPQALPGSKMASAGGDWKTNPRTQIKWGLDYIAGRHGTPGSALNHHDRFNWYSRGGVIPGFGPKSIMAHGGERVLPEGLNQSFESLANSIELWSARGNGASPVDVGGSGRELREQNELLRENNRRLDELPERMGSAGAKIAAAYQFSDSFAEGLDRLLEEAFADGADHLPQ